MVTKETEAITEVKKSQLVPASVHGKEYLNSLPLNQVRFLVPIIREGWTQALLDHESMVNSFKRRDKESIGLIMKKHLDTKINITVKGA